jgi:nitroimidazol reductase NimA-like FMN-containing flavoprotein (pyridoxamine 5'-phosphate oxidase superfamily)
MSGPRGRRTEPARLTDRVSADWTAAAELIADVPVGHVGFCVGGRPRVMPIAICGDGPTLLLHGSSGSPWLRAVAEGIDVSVAVTSLDGLIVARSAFESSMRYRSAVLFGTCRPVTEHQMGHALDLLTEALIRGRTGEVRRPTVKELKATLVLRMAVEEFSLKRSDGWPEDPPSDRSGTAWAGVVLPRRGYDTVIPAPDLDSTIAVPPSVRMLVEGR